MRIVHCAIDDDDERASPRFKPLCCYWDEIGAQGRMNDTAVHVSKFFVYKEIVDGRSWANTVHSGYEVCKDCSTHPDLPLLALGELP